MAQSQRTSRGERGTGSFEPFDVVRSALRRFLSTFETRVEGDDYEAREPETTPEVDTKGADTATTDGSEAHGPESAPPIDFATMEPESALYALVCREGGKMKQSAMVPETGWSKSKVSRRLSNLEDAGRIGRVRQGREKVVFVKPDGSGAKPDVEADA